MKSEFNVIIEKDRDGWLVASVPELPGCHTQGKSMDVLLDRVREAIALCLEEYEGDKAARNEFIGIQRVAVDICPAPRA